MEFLKKLFRKKDPLDPGVEPSVPAADPVPPPVPEEPSLELEPRPSKFKKIGLALAGLLGLLVLAAGGFLGVLWKSVPAAPSDVFYLEKLIPAGSLGALAVRNPADLSRRISEAPWAKTVFKLLSDGKLEGKIQKWDRNASSMIERYSFHQLRLEPAQILGSRMVVSGFLRVGKPRLRYLAVCLPDRRAAFGLALHQRFSKTGVLEKYGDVTLLDLGESQYAALIGPVLAFSNDQGLLKNAVDLAKTPGASLGQDERYVKLANGESLEPIAGFVDFQGIQEALKPYMALAQGMPAKDSWNGMDAVSFRISLEGGLKADYRTLWKLPLDPRLQAASRLTPRSFGMAALAPENAVLAQGAVWNPQETWDAMEKGMPPTALPWLASWKAWDKKLKVKDRFLPVLGEEAGLILQMNGSQDNSLKDFEWPNVMFLLQAKDVQGLEKAMAQAWALWPQNQTKGKGRKKPIRPKEPLYQGVNIHTVRLVPGGNPFFDISPSYCFVKDYLVLSLTKEGCQAVVDTDKGIQKPLTGTASYKALGFPEKSLSFYYLDLEKLVMGLVSRAQKWSTLVAANAGYPSVPPRLLAWSQPLGATMEPAELGQKGRILWPMQDLPQEDWDKITAFWTDVKSKRAAPPMTAQVPPASAKPDIQAVPVPEPEAKPAAKPAESKAPAVSVPAPVAVKASSAPVVPSAAVEPEGYGDEPKPTKLVTLELLNGQTVTGVLVEENRAGYTLLISNLGSMTFSRKEVLSVER